MGIADAHHAHVHFDGHVVGGEGHDARRNAQREGVAGFVGSLHGRVVGEARLRASGRERHLVEQREAFVASQRDVLPPDRRRRIGLLERVEIPGHDVRARLLVAEMQFGVVQLEQRARIDEASSEGHVVPEGVGDHRADAEGVAFRVDSLDDEELIAFVGMGRVGGRTAENPLSFRHEQVVRVGKSALLAHFVDRFRTLVGCRRSLGGGCFLCAQRLRRAREAQREGERADE